MKMIYLCLVFFLFGGLMGCDHIYEYDRNQINSYAFFNELQCFSPDSVHAYRINPEKFIKYKRGDDPFYRENVWEKEFVVPENVVIDKGYGDKLVLSYTALDMLETKEYIYVFYTSTFSSESVDYLKNIPVYIGKFSLSGDFVSMITIFCDVNPDSSYVHGFLVDFENGNIGLQLKTHFVTINGNSDQIVETFDLDDSWDMARFCKYRYKFINNSFLGFGSDFVVFNWAKKKNVQTNIIEQLFPNEVNKPLLNYTCNEVFFKNGVEFDLNVTMYSGEKKQVRVFYEISTNDFSYR